MISYPIHYFCRAEAYFRLHRVQKRFPGGSMPPPYNRLLYNNRGEEIPPPDGDR